LRDLLRTKQQHIILLISFKDLPAPVPYTWSFENEATTYYIDILCVGFLREEQQHDYTDICQYYILRHSLLKTNWTTYNILVITTYYIIDIRISPFPCYMLWFLENEATTYCYIYWYKKCLLTWILFFHWIQLTGNFPMDRIFCPLDPMDR
jgi:hypothetical protein